MWQDRLLHYAVFTKASEEFAPHYLAEIRHDMRQTTFRYVISASMHGNFWMTPHAWALKPMGGGKRIVVQCSAYPAGHCRVSGVGSVDDSTLLPGNAL